MSPQRPKRPSVRTRIGRWPGEKRAAQFIRSKHSLLTMPREIRDMILGHVTSSPRDSVRLVAHEGGALRKFWRCYKQNFAHQRAGFRMQNARYAFRRKDERVQEQFEKARRGANHVSFDIATFPLPMEAVYGPLLVNHQMAGEVQESIMRENIVTFKPTHSAAGEVRMARNPQSYSWDPLNDTQRKILREAQRLRILLMHPLEIYALAQALQQRSREGLRSLEICFLASSEAELGTRSEGDGLPARFWATFEAGTEALKQIPADLVTFTCHQFADETRGAYRHEKRKLDRRVIFSGKYADMSPRLKDLCAPVGEAMMELAKNLAQNKRKRSRDEDDGDNQGALQRKRICQDTVRSEMNALDTGLVLAVTPNIVSADTLHGSSGAEVDETQAEERSIFGLSQEAPAHEADHVPASKPARVEKGPVSRKRAHSNVSDDDPDVVPPQAKRHQLHSLSPTLATPTSRPSAYSASIPNVPSPLSQITNIDDDDDDDVSQPSGDHGQDSIAVQNTDADMDEMAAEMLAEMEKERDWEAGQQADSVDDCHRTEEEMREWEAELEAMMQDDAEDDVEVLPKDPDAAGDPTSSDEHHPINEEDEEEEL